MPHDIDSIPPEFGPEPGWSVLPMPRNFGKGKSFVSGDPDSNAIRIFYYRRDEDGHFLGKLKVGYDAEGPADHAHGGSMAAILDEAMGFSAWVEGHPVVAASITINFLKSLPLERLAIVEAFVDDVEGNKVRCLGKIKDATDGHTYADGQGLFIKQPLERFGDLAAVAERAGGARDNTE